MVHGTALLIDLGRITVCPGIYSRQPGAETPNNHMT